MKASQLLVLGVLTFSVSFVVAAPPAPSPTSHDKRASSDKDRVPAPCLISTEKCSAQNDPPPTNCHLGAKRSESCPTDGFKVMRADSR